VLEDKQKLYRLPSPILHLNHRIWDSVTVVVAAVAEAEIEVEAVAEEEEVRFISCSIWVFVLQ
jgi:hypothetical protein